MFSLGTLAGLAVAATFLCVVGFSVSVIYLVGGKRMHIMGRLKGLDIPETRQDEDILERPLYERTVGQVLKAIGGLVGQATPTQFLWKIENKLAVAGNPRNRKASDFLTRLGIAFSAVGLGTFVILRRSDMGILRVSMLALAAGSLAAYLPWFQLGVAGTKRKKAFRRSLPDVMDLLVVCVEAGLSFDMALMRVVERFGGTISDEFQRVLRETRLGKPRKDALRDMCDRVDVTELSSLVSAIIQAEQLGVGVSSVLRMQSDLIREKRQQFIEEQAMKAPIKMLFPLVFFIFPSIFVVILGPALLNIFAVLSGM